MCENICEWCGHGFDDDQIDCGNDDCPRFDPDPLVDCEVSLYENKGDKSQIIFNCAAEDEAHAREQALNAYPNGKVVCVATFGDKKGFKCWQPKGNRMNMDQYELDEDGIHWRPKVAKGFEIEYRVYTQHGDFLVLTSKYRIAHDYALGYKTRTGESLVVKTLRKEN